MISIFFAYTSFEHRTPTSINFHFYINNARVFISIINTWRKIRHMKELLSAYYSKIHIQAVSFKASVKRL